jgi:two-component system cell cycle sensor histidine kinase/response regulator CckA
MIAARRRKRSPVKSWRPWERWPMGAHDFNNFLSGVLTQAELALSELAAASLPEEELKAICSVAMSGSEIVRQLMIYTGQEREAPGLVSVTRTVEEMAEILSFRSRNALFCALNLTRIFPPSRPAAHRSGKS